MNLDCPVCNKLSQQFTLFRPVRVGLLALSATALVGNAFAQNNFPASGNVGIGTTSPQTLLDVGMYRTTSLFAGIALENTINDGNYNSPMLLLGSGTWFNNGQFLRAAALQAVNDNWAVGQKALAFYTYDGHLGNNFTSATLADLYERMRISSSGNVGIGTATPSAKLHLADTFGVAAAAAPNSVGNANLVVQSAYGARTVGVGSALSFAVPANTDGTNIWEQARIVGTPDNVLTFDAHGRMYLQTRTSTSQGWVWNNNLLLTSDGSTTVGGNLKFTAGSGAAVTYQDGTTQSTAWNGVLQGGDYAESVDVSGNRAEYEPGDVLVVDRKAEGRFVKSNKPYSTAVMGIYSTRPGVVGRRQKSDRSHMAEEVPMAMIGVVPTKVTDEGGPIEPGDLLVTSSTPGYAMKGTDHSQMMGAIIGKALGHLDSGTGVIEVAVSLQ